MWKYAFSKIRLSNNGINSIRYINMHGPLDLITQHMACSSIQPAQMELLGKRESQHIISNAQRIANSFFLKC